MGDLQLKPEAASPWLAGFLAKLFLIKSRECMSLSHLEGLHQMGAQDTLAGCFLMQPPRYHLHQFGSKTGGFGVDVKIKYSSFITAYAFTGFLGTCGAITRPILLVCILKHNFTDAGAEGCYPSSLSSKLTSAASKQPQSLSKQCR